MAADPTSEMHLRNALLTCSEMGVALLDGWREELRALKKPSKREKWHAKLRDTPGGALKVRYTGGVRHFNIEDERVPYEFEYYQPPTYFDGGVWYPIGDYKNYASMQGANPVAGFMVAKAAKKKRRESILPETRALIATLNAMPEKLRDHFEILLDKLDEGGERTVRNVELATKTMIDLFPAEFLATSEVIGGWPPELQELRHHLEGVVLDMAVKQREERRSLKNENRRRGFAERDAAVSSSTSVPVAAAPMPMANDPVAPSGDQTVDRMVERANDEARQHKILTKRATIQASLARPAAEADDAAGQPVPAEANLSKNARRRQEKKAKQQRAEQRRIDEKQQRADDEFRKILKVVEPLRQESGTVVREDMECLRELDLQLKKEERQTKTKPRRAVTQEEADVAHALLETGQLRGRMRQEAEAFVRGFAGIAPDAEGFAERLVILLIGDAGGWHDAREVAEELYGDLADAYAAHDWSEQRLQRARRRVVLRAAALA